MRRLPSQWQSGSLADLQCLWRGQAGAAATEGKEEMSENAITACIYVLLFFFAAPLVGSLLLGVTGLLFSAVKWWWDFCYQIAMEGWK